MTTAERDETELKPAMSFAEMLTEARTGREMQQKVFAGLVGISPQYLNDLESGRRLPSVTIVEKIVSYLGRGPIGRSDWHIAGARAHGWDIPSSSAIAAWNKRAAS